jgi:hypothetical protein
VLADCIRIICEEYQRRNISSNDDLLAIQRQMQERKGLK